MKDTFNIFQILLVVFKEVTSSWQAQKYASLKGVERHILKQMTPAITHTLEDQECWQKLMILEPGTSSLLPSHLMSMSIFIDFLTSIESIILQVTNTFG